MEEFPDTKAAQDVADYDGVKALTLAFYNGATEVYKITQFRADKTTYTTFGEFDCPLPMGTYTMVVLGYGLKDSEPGITLTSPTSATYSENTVRETFAATQTVTINTTEAVDISTWLFGQIFSNDSVSAGFQVETDWLEGNTMNF